MTATVETATESQRTSVLGPRPQALESGFEAALLGSVGKAIGAPTAHDPAGLGHGSASAAPGKRKEDAKEVIKRARAMSDPAAVAAGELATHGTPKATVQAAEAQQVTADSNASQPRGRANGAPSQQAKPASGEAQSLGSQSAKSEHGKSKIESNGGPAATKSESASKRPAINGGAHPVPKAAAAQAKPLDAGQALARLAQAINRAADRPAASVNPNRSVLRVETARAAQRGAPAKPAAPTNSSNRAQQAQDDFAAQLHRGFSAVLRQNGGSLTLRMQPESLGDLTIRMDLQPGQVGADFEVGSDQARQLLSDHMTSLRSALEARGLSVDKLTVSVSERPTPEAAANRAELGAHGGAGNPSSGGGGASGGRADQSGVERPLASQVMARSADDVVSDPGSGPDVHVGGAQTVRLVLDAVA